MSQDYTELVEKAKALNEALGGWADLSPFIDAITALQQTLEAKRTAHLTDATALAKAYERITALEQELDELQATFDLRWDADMRAIKRWQAAHPGNDLTWPDHADMVVWLLGERDRIEAAYNGEHATSERLRQERDELKAELERRTVKPPISFGRTVR